MKKISRVLILLLIISVSLTTFVSCTDEFFDDGYQSGDRIDLTLENYLNFVDIKSKKLEIKKNESLFAGIIFKFEVSGNDSFSYFNVEIAITVSAQALQDDGAYHEIKFIQPINLDENGDGYRKDTHSFGTEYRNIKDLVAEVTEVKGFVVKK